jgi:hypothetical protein
MRDLLELPIAEAPRVLRALWTDRTATAARRGLLHRPVREPASGG